MNYGRASGPIEAALLEFLRANAIPPGDRLCVAYSAGPDSTALLAAARAICPLPPLAAHVDHGLRPEAELAAELSIAKATCSGLGSGLCVARIRRGAVERLSREGGLGTEAAARELRYRALRGIMRHHGLAWLLLAHTRDDLAEGLLMRLLAGSGSAGLRGIPSRRAGILRPFLGLGKAELLDYLRERKLLHSSDSSNASPDYLRNRVRSLLIPLLDQDFRGWRKGLATTARRAAEEAEALDRAAAVLCPPFAASAWGGLEVGAQAFLKAPLALRLRSLVDAVGRIQGKSRSSMGMARAAIKVLEEGAYGYSGAGIRVSLEGDLVCVRTEARDGLDFPRIGGYFVVVDRPCRIRVGALIVEAHWTTGASTGIRADAFRFPLVIRSRRPGDAIAIPGGEKRLDELFSEWRLSARLRGLVPVAEDRDGIVAVLGAAFGAKDRFRTGPGPEGQERRRLSVVVKGA